MSRRTTWIVVAAVIAVAIVGGVVWMLFPRGGSATDQALAYLRALADGDITAVEATGVNVSEEAASAFLSASGYINDVTVDTTVDAAETDETSTLVHVSFLLGDEQIESELTMVSEGGRWMPEVTTALGSVRGDVPAGIGEAVLAADAEYVLLPAEYTIVAEPTDFLDGTAVIQVLPGSSQDVELAATLRPEATGLAEQQLDEYLATCTQPGTEAPDSCGIAIPWAADFTSVNGILYRIEQTPTMSLTPTTFRADAGVLIATVSGTDLDGAAKTLSYRTDNWALRGDISFTADDIVLSVW